MRILFLLGISLQSFVWLSAQDFNVLAIPDSLRRGAHSVKRLEEYVIDIKSPGKARVYERHVYTIMNSNAGHLATYRAYYTQFVRINSVTGVLYSSSGKELKRLKKKDWQDLSVYDGMSIANDIRVKENEFSYNEYPFTVEFEEEDEIDGLMSIPTWFPVSEYGMSLENSKYTIIAPANYEIRYRAFKFSDPPRITEKDGKKIYSWEIRNMAAIRREDRAPDLLELVPSVQFAPSDVEVEGYKGNMSTWTDYGKFMNQLLIGKDNLPADMKDKIHSIVAPLKTDKEKVVALYEFMQRNTHYISIQLGIGGWRPFDATYVADKKYGDCKALSNYMVALLKEAGIQAKYVVISAGEDARPLLEDFPRSQFNHAVACVPLGKDTIWLECTSQTQSAGFMGSFTGNRKAVIIDESGGHVVSTPRYGINENRRTSVVTALINNEGMLDATIKTQYSGIEQELPHALMNEVSKDTREKYLNKMLGLPSYEVISNEYDQRKGPLPTVDERLQIKANAYATVTGKRLILNPNILRGSSERLVPDSARKHDFLVNRSYTHVDSIMIDVPVGFRLESVPREVSIDNKFGQYSSSVKWEANRLVYYRFNMQLKGQYAAAEYNELVKYFDQIYKADRSSVVFVKE
jgi:hypothetical protein